MKPKYKERLVRCRPAMVRSMDVTTILHTLRQDGVFSKQDEDVILQDTRRRERVIRFLDILEKKKSEVYSIFLEALGDVYPQLYLSLSDWDEEPDVAVASAAQLDDDFSLLHRARDYLINEIDASEILPYMRKHDVINDKEEITIRKESEPPRRTEVFLDILEVYPPSAFDTFVEACGEVYPHVYLVLTDDKTDGYDDDDDFY